LALAGDAAKHRAASEPRKLDPALQRRNRAGRVGRAAADLHLAPAGLAAHCQQQALIENLDPASAVLRLVAAKVEPGDFRTAQRAGKADQQHGAIPDATQGAAVEGSQHRYYCYGLDRPMSIWMTRIL